MFNIETWNSLCVECHNIAVEKGWWDREKSIAECLALIASEGAEAIEAYREHGLESYTGENGKPEGFASELADVVIRCADLRGALNTEKCYWSERDTEEDRFFGGIIYMCEPRFLEPEQIARRAYLLAESYGIDLDSVIREKIEFNKTRSYRHGGKRA